MKLPPSLHIYFVIPPKRRETEAKEGLWYDNAALHCWGQSCLMAKVAVTQICCHASCLWMSLLHFVIINIKGDILSPVAEDKSTAASRAIWLTGADLGTVSQPLLQ